MSGTGQAAANPFAQQLLAIQAGLPPSPPPSYRYHLIGQMVLLGSLAVFCLLYLGISTYDNKKRGKKIALFKLQRMDGGRIIVLNTLYLYVIVVFCGAVVLAGYAGRKFETLILGRSAKNMSIYSIQTWTGPLLSGWIFTFSTASAALQISKKHALFASGSTLSVYVHNATFFIFPCLYFGGTIPLGFLTNKYTNKSIDLLSSLVAQLTQAATLTAKGQAVDPAALAAIQKTAAELADVKALTTRYSRANVLFAMASVVAFASMCAASYTFVLLLRRQSKWNAQRAFISGSIFVTRDQRSVVDDPNFPQARPDNSAPTTTSAFPRPSCKKPQPVRINNSSEEATALAQLANNLTLSVPLMALESTFFILTGAIALTVLQKDRSWSAREFSLDAFSWGHACTQTSIVGFFLVNAIFRPGRFGRAFSSDKGNDSSAQIGSGSKGRVASRDETNSEFHVKMVPLRQNSNEKVNFIEVTKPDQASLPFDGSTGHPYALSYQKETAVKWDDDSQEPGKYRY